MNEAAPNGGFASRGKGLVPVHRMDVFDGTLGGPTAIEPVWWSLALGACLGGNGSLIGAAANVMVAGLGDRSGYPISFITFAKIGIPVMLVSVAVANVYVYLVFF